MAHYSLMHVFSYNHINDLKKDETSSYVRFPNYSSQKTFKNTKRLTAQLQSSSVVMYKSGSDRYLYTRRERNESNQEVCRETIKNEIK